MHLQGFWHVFAAEQGNVPGPHMGDVTVTLLQPVGGIGEFTISSNDVSIAAEAGNLLGVQAVLDDGRKIFVMAGNVAGIVDAPQEKPAASSRRGSRSGDGHGHQAPEGEKPGPDGPEDDEAGATPADVAAAHDKAEAAHDKSEAAEDKATAAKRRPGK
jgi:hypothetical protein